MTASALASSFPTISFEDYLETEARTEAKNEYFYGHVYMMAGGTNRHHIIAAAAVFQLTRILARKNCQVLASDARIVTPDSKAVFYPDASVHCGNTLPPLGLTATSPTLILEILSPSTKRYDLSTKRKEYFRIPSLQHYLLLDSEALEATLYSRSDSGTAWVKEPQTFTDPKSVIPLPHLKIQLKLRDLYRQTDLIP